MSQEVQQHVLNKYVLGKKVGSGAYGHVWKVTQKRTGNVLALKKIFDAFQHSVDAQRTYRQICYLHELNHNNIIKLYNVIRADNDKDLYLVFEYMEADLHNAIGQKILKDVHNRFIMYQILKAIKYLHSTEIIHRDLKPSNVLINSDCLLKICDFGLARSLLNDEEAGDVIMTEEVATRWYRAPQVLLGSQTYDKAADVWSIGCILGELIIGKPLFPGTSTLNQLERILTFTGKPSQEDINSLDTDVANTMIESISVKFKGMKEWFKSDTPIEAIDLIRKMLHFNQQKRISIVDALKHTYLSQFSNPKEEFASKRSINLPISDNRKLNLKQYKQLIYQRIRKIYSAETAEASVEKRISYSLQKPKEVLKQKQRDLRNSQNNMRMTKSNSASKFSSPNQNNWSLSTSAVFRSITSEEEKEKVRRRQWLKEMLHMKRERVSLKPQRSIKTDNFNSKPSSPLIKTTSPKHHYEIYNPR